MRIRQLIRVAALKIVMDSPATGSLVNMQTDTCLVLMFKSPQRSKQRLAAEIGTRAHTAAMHLFECAIEDLNAWAGPTCLSPANDSDMHFIDECAVTADLLVQQENGNLGERIMHVNAGLLSEGHQSQLFIGIDCPALDTTYLCEADAALSGADAVLGPAEDGGVVLMGINGQWPELKDLPWSTGDLGETLIDVCSSARLDLRLLESHRDVDSLNDLQRLPGELGSDSRPGRRRLCEWIETEAFA